MVALSCSIFCLRSLFCSGSAVQDSCIDSRFHLAEACYLFLWRTNQESGDVGNLWELTRDKTSWYLPSRKKVRLHSCHRCPTCFLYREANRSVTTSPGTSHFEARLKTKCSHFLFRGWGGGLIWAWKQGNPRYRRNTRCMCLCCSLTSSLVQFLFSFVWYSLSYINIKKNKGE